MMTVVLIAISALAAPPSGSGNMGPGGGVTPAGGGGEQPFPGGRPASPAPRSAGASPYAGSAEPEIAAAEAAVRAAEVRAREAQIEVSRRVSELQEARMGVDLARAEVELRQLKAGAGSAEVKSRIKAVESRVSVLRSLIKDDLPAMRDLQARMLRAQLEDPSSLGPIQVELAGRQRLIARKQVELEIATLKAAGGDPGRLQALERRLEDLKRQSPAGPPAKTPPGQSSGKKKGKP